MSLILDALRKSEAERRRGEAPGLFTALPTPGARPLQVRSNGPWISAGILVLIAVAALAWWFRAPAPVIPTPAPAISRVVATPTLPVAPQQPVHTESADFPPPPPPSQRTPEPNESGALDPGVRRADEFVQSVPKPPLIAPPEPPAAPKPAIVEPPLEALPTLAMLDPSERAGLPPLKLSMHVWSEAPNARLAIIDGQRVMEGSAIGESIVAEIRRDGVVLELRGHRYLLPRP